MEAPGIEYISSCCPAFGLALSQAEVIPNEQFQPHPQAMGNGMITRSPILNCFTSAPTSTTSPMNSWPIMSYSFPVGACPLYRCSSEPQIAVELTLTMMSFGLRICGSG